MQNTPQDWLLTPHTSPGSDFPGLWKTLRPPTALYAHGTARALAALSQLPERGLGVVGTRDPRPQTVLALRRWIHKLSGQSIVVVSGFARGIDAAAHRAALDAGLPTVAVLGTSIESRYPVANQELRRELLRRDGLLITEFPPGADTHKANFLERNRLIAGWSQATFVAEAGKTSGALNTAMWARRHDRVCFAAPGWPEDPAFAGNRKLLENDESPARLFWDAYSLGSVWLELASVGVGPNASKARPQSDSTALAGHVNEMTNRRGGVSAEELLDWAIGLEWPPQRFFIALQNALSERLFEDDRGTLRARP